MTTAQDGVDSEDRACASVKMTGGGGGGG